MFIFYPYQRNTQGAARIFNQVSNISKTAQSFRWCNIKKKKKTPLLCAFFFSLIIYLQLIFSPMIYLSWFFTPIAAILNTGLHFYWDIFSYEWFMRILISVIWHKWLCQKFIVNANILANAHLKKGHIMIFKFESVNLTFHTWETSLKSSRPYVW